MNKEINWMKFRPVYFTISLFVILIGVFSILKYGFTLGVEFTGGTTVEYRFEHDVSSEELSNQLGSGGIEVSAIQKVSDNDLLIKLGELDSEKESKLKEIATQVGGEKSELLRYEKVGPSLSAELVKKTLYALIFASVAILCWIAYQFKNIKFGVSATVATLHDAFVVIGIYTLLGHFFKAEIDFLFVTALLTILSFSVHDTIIVYDRIREIRKKHGGSIYEVSNRAVSETMRRSIFNSLTIIIMLTALVVLGGSSIRFFAAALLIGTISGTYSSPFVAVPVLVTWEQLLKRRKKA